MKQAVIRLASQYMPVIVNSCIRTMQLLKLLHAQEYIYLSGPKITPGCIDMLFLRIERIIRDAIV